MKNISKSIYKQKILYGLEILIILIKAYLSVELAVILKNLIDSFNKTTISDIKRNIIYIITFIIIFVIVQIIYNFLSALIIKKVLIDIKNNTIKGILKLSIMELHQKNTSKYISLLTNHIDDVEKDYLNSLINLLDMGVMLIFSLIMLFKLNPIIGGVALASTFISFIVPAVISNHGNILKLNYSIQQEDLTKFTKDIFNGFDLIKEYQVESNISKKYNEKNNKVELSRYRYNYIVGIIMGISMFLGYIIFFSVVIAGLILSLANNITVGTLIACVNLSNSLVNPIMNGLEQIFKIKAIKGIGKKFDIKSQIQKNGTIDMNQSVDKIEVKDVTYDYNGIRGIENINLVFEKGKKYLIVGTSGSGKSTLLKLLAGYFFDFKGQVLVNGIDIRKINDNSLNKIYSIVNQEPFLFDGTIEDNIRFFQEIKDEVLQKAINQTKLETLINKQQNSIKTEVGEDGNKISGGEKQRISIARALVRKSNIILLDEATSNLDNEISFIIEDAILSQENIVISISHRLVEEIITKYDQIIAINNGKIVEVGSFDELIRKKGLFYSLFYLNSLENMEKKSND